LTRKAGEVSIIPSSISSMLGYEAAYSVKQFISSTLIIKLLDPKKEKKKKNTTSFESVLPLKPQHLQLSDQKGSMVLQGSPT